MNEVVAGVALYTFSFVVFDGARDGVAVSPTYEALVGVQRDKPFPRRFPARLNVFWATVLRREI